MSLGEMVDFLHSLKRHFEPPQLHAWHFYQYISDWESKHRPED